MVRPRTMTGRRLSKQKVIDRDNYFAKQRRTASVSSNSINKMAYFHVQNPIPEHINLFDGRVFEELYEQVSPTETLDLSIKALETRPKNMFAYLLELQGLVRKLCQQVLVQQELINKAISELNRMDDQVGERSRKRWTEQEDNLLIEQAAKDNATTVELARIFGRTPGAIQSRISYLVGIERLSSKVAGRFIGTIDGEQAEVEIDGIVSKR